MNVLVYHAGALGDFVTTLPALLSWRRRHAPRRMVLLGRPHHGVVGELAGCIDEFVDADAAAWAPLFAGKPVQEGGLAGGMFRTALVFAHHPSLLAQGLTRCGCEVRLCRPFPRSGGEHAVEFHLRELLDDPAACWGNHPLIPLERVEREKLDPPCVCIHPGSGSRAKNWPAQQYRRLAQRVLERGAEVVWIIGPADGEASPPPGCRFLEGAPIERLVQTLGRGSLFVGNDSGVTHLAAACGMATVALFGPSDPSLWSPRGPRVHIVRSPTTAMDGILPDVVWEAVERFGSIFGCGVVPTDGGV